MLLTKDHIATDFDLPDNTKELDKIKTSINFLKISLKKTKYNNDLNDETYKIYHKRIVDILYYVGKLSMPAFNIEKDLEDMYKLKYPNFPVLAQKLWFDHNEKIHAPYSFLKNRCFKFVNSLNAQYVKQYNKQPPS